ncbi:hypothetical protein BDV25DRAFT_132164 [Aspergillus avenaceus]|uniref:Zn(2)-C6 fungal-type domain-containing protein n=1 Tax=Aspergillus avenaceus TaxID=36643 RepID=A0A5N6TLX6_ASPAV|nr:hypothetical protein BDV25DRAFT_132164 [Aspergillus avenaceus]
MRSSLADRTAPPRRKSCEACKVAKRRCDLAYPACTRCASRSLACVYPGRQPVPPEFPEPYPWFSTDDLSLPFETPMYTPDFKVTLSDMGYPLGVLNPQSPYMDPLENMSWEITPPDVTPGSYELEAPKSRTISLSEAIASRLQFAIDMLKKIPKMMVRETQTPWCHKQLYRDGLPKYMQGKKRGNNHLTKKTEAYTTCTLHITKNRTNTPIINSLINTNIQSHLTASVPTNPQETLAHTHALLLYQIICIFSDDTTSLPAPETILPHLESSAMLLLSCIYFPDTSTQVSVLPSTPEETLDFWTSWVFQESARRTVLFTFYLTQIFRVIQGYPNLNCDGRLGLVHSFYFSARLWLAQDPVGFAEAWTMEDHFLVGELNFERVLVDAKASDVDAFGRMLLVTFMGIEQARTWFLVRGEVL